MSPGLTWLILLASSHFNALTCTRSGSDASQRAWGWEQGSCVPQACKAAIMQGMEIKEASFDRPPKRSALKWHFCRVPPLKCPTSSLGLSSPDSHAPRSAVLVPLVRGGYQMPASTLGFQQEQLQRTSPWGLGGTCSVPTSYSVWLPTRRGGHPLALILLKTPPWKLHVEGPLPCNKNKA